MGIWGHKPTENDRAADWVDGLFESTGIGPHIAETLNHNVEDHADEIRVAAHLVQVLDDSDLWESETKQKMRSLAATRLKDVLEKQVFSNPGLIKEIRSELSQLRGDCGVVR